VLEFKRTRRAIWPQSKSTSKRKSENRNLKFINLTRRTEIGANSYYLEAAGQRLVLDCGMHPKEEGEEALPNFRALGDRALDAIIVSHSHLDHIGTLPVLMRRQPHARIFMTEATAEIGSALLHNSVSVMTRQREEIGVAIYPLFTHKETDRATDRWRWCPIGQPFTLEGERAKAHEADALTVEFVDAGHVLGAAGVILRAEGRTIFYSGDVNFDDQTITKGAIFPDAGVDVLIIETTRGDSPLPQGFTRAAEEGRLADAITRAFTRGGCVLIPVFALGKTQEVLAMIHKFRREKLLGEFPVYIGGLSTKMTEIYDRRALTTRRLLPRLQLLEEIAPFVLNGKTINESPAQAGRVYALSSGMMTPKTLSNIFARRVLENPKHSIFFVGYADPESPAGVLKTAQPGAMVALDPDEPAQPLRCRIEQFQFSAHASRESLVRYVKQLDPKKIVLVHGDVPAVEWTRGALTAELPGSEVIVPAPGVELEL
jgi:Cft2 family RNA processing exonuclease